MIDRGEPSFSGNLIARMKNGKKVSISRRYVSKLKERLGI
ncbi:MAG TPA: LytTR family transcriptional regulator DNA-binding domain-containing protein [Candidatus Salinicoccus stercoripullorum]|uniref:LytTR family transcriptional regulator DNA-binding domain-containing protein n=1 Tax=Candidatus Salinicoccus stercoripullorum TaxID=2838756 RepID=A0A9D1QG73_9STAP|nr:LytTR family transcriptional regulator DNA-binding domain-containing protein [Candidatus Salinicoccus stercoripullorum]